MRVLVAIVLSSALCFPSVGQRGEELDFPTNAEISLMVTQTERAIDQYATLVHSKRSYCRAYLTLTRLRTSG
jgi:hypothetical protein